MCWFLALAALYITARISFERGERPLHKLRPAVYSYRVETLLEQDADHVMLLLFHYEGNGRFKWRIANLPTREFNEIPRSGEHIEVQPSDAPYRYVVV